ncbi:hypothetical protein [Nocardia arizonensis]|uniref:hypothetical protein n=1 Tax=Nocardia arizonensis TaxID=1141647 RepID=UPI0006D27BE7|nr:hypothetical protein [Nocardia arizonensis]
MANVIAVDSTTDLHSAAVVMDSVADAIEGAVRVLADTLTTLGDPISVQDNGNEASKVTARGDGTPPWGTDSYGKQFAQGDAGYVKLGVGLLQGGFDLAHTLSEFATGMGRAAGDVRRSEDEASAGFA